MMMDLSFQNIVSIVIASVGIFLALFPHVLHCQLADIFKMSCGRHQYHVIGGIVLFLVAVYMRQGNFLKM